MAEIHFARGENMNRNSKIAVVIPVGPESEGEIFDIDCFAFARHVYIFNPTKRSPMKFDLAFPHPLGITEANRQGFMRALELEPDIICLCDCGSYSAHLERILDFHLTSGKPVTITARRNPRWEKWTGKVGSRIVHYAARWILGLPFKDNCSGLYVFTHRSPPWEVKYVIRDIQSKHHFFDTELRYRLLRYFDPSDIAEYTADNIVTGGNTANWKELKDTVVNFYRLWRTR